MEQELIETAVYQIQVDLAEGDLEALYQLFEYIPSVNLNGFLSDTLRESMPEVTTEDSDTLYDCVIYQMREDLADNNWTEAIAELIGFAERNAVIDYLPSSLGMFFNYSE